MEHSIAHDLPLERAQRAARGALESYAARFAKYNPELVWKDESHAAIAFTAKGVRLEGNVAVERERFLVDLKVPLLLRVFAGRALKVLDEEAIKWIAKAKAEQS